MTTSPSSTVAARTASGPASEDVGVVVPLGAIGAIGVAAAMTAVRDQVGQTNAALVLVLVIVLAAAFGGRLAGMLTALCAAVSFNFFFTKPYLTLRINDRQDVERMILLFVVGLVVGELTLLRDRRGRRHVSGQGNARHVHRMAELVRDGAGTVELWTTTRVGISDALGVAPCRFVRADAAATGGAGASAGAGDRADLGASVVGGGAVFADGGFRLPDSGVSLPVRRRDRDLGRIVVDGPSAHPVTAEDRATAITLADLFAIGLGDGPVPESLG